MKPFVKPVVVALGVTAALGACAAPIKLVPAGPYKIASGPSVTLDKPWNDISAIWFERPEKVRLLSLDGPLLNRLYITDGLVEGDVLVRAPRKEARTPVYSVEMSLTEQVEFVAESVTALGYEHVETLSIRPFDLGGERAVRFDITAQTPEGLEIKGLGQAVKRDGKLYVAVYLAPSEHYFAANLASAEKAMGSLVIS